MLRPKVPSLLCVYFSSRPMALKIMYMQVIFISSQTPHPDSLANSLNDLFIWMPALFFFKQGQNLTLDFLSHFSFSKPASALVLPNHSLALPFTQLLKLETSFWILPFLHFSPRQPAGHKVSSSTTEKHPSPLTPLSPRP